MKCFMVLIPAGLSEVDSRPACESIENQVFTIDDGVCESIQAESVRKAVCSVLQIEASSDAVEVLPISDFMCAANDEEFDIDSYFISYVYGDVRAD